MAWNEGAAAGFSTGNHYRALAANAATNHVAAQAADPASLLKHYKALLALRKSVAALRDGDYANATVEGALLTYQRRTSTQHAVVALNFGSTAASTTVTGLPPNATLQAAYPPGGNHAGTDSAGQAVPDLPAQSLRGYTIAR